LTKTKEFIVKVIRIEQTDAEKLAADNAWLSDEIILYGNTALDNVTWDLSLPAVGPNGSTISWSSTNSDVIMTDETVIRPSYTLGDQSITLTAVISNGASATKTFIIIEKAAEPTDDEILNLDAEWLTIEKIQNGNTAYNNILCNLSLLNKEPMRSDIHWESGNEAVVDASGSVTRPDYASGDKAVTLTATLSKSSTVTKPLQ